MNPFHHLQPLRQVLAWLLIGLMPLQGLAAGVLGAMGTLHVHRATAEPVVLALTDFRRETPLAAEVEQHVFSVLGHVHRHGVAERHHHADRDASVVPQGDGAGDWTPSPALAAWVALPVQSMSWVGLDGAPLHGRHTAWTPGVHHPSVLERPPREA